MSRRQTRAGYWFRRHRQAMAEAGDGVLPEMTVTDEEYEEIKAEGKPWTTLDDGTEMWGGIVIRRAAS